MHDLAAKLAVPARWLMVAAIAYTLATSVLYFLSPPPTGPVTDARSATAQSSTPPVDVNAILASNLFGAAESGGAQVAEAPAVATQLPLELLGVFVADRPENSAAIIAQRGKPGQLYTVGEDVPGNAALLEVHPTHVVLRRAGIRETLHFPTGSAAIAARATLPEPEAGFDEPVMEPLPDEFEDAAMEPPPDEATPDEQSVRALVDEYRERLEQDPAGTLQSLGVSAVADGAAEGYRLGNLAQSPYLSQTGLQPGDVILSVNGRPVGDLEQDRLEMDNVLAQGSARLEVQRGTRRFFVTASLQQ